MGIEDGGFVGRRRAWWCLGTQGTKDGCRDARGK